MFIAPSTITLRDGESLVLRSPGHNDAHAMLSFRQTLLAESADNLNQFSNGADGVTVDQQCEMIQRMTQDPKAFWITAFAGETIVGNIGVHPELAPRLTHVGTIGMGCLRAYQGRGLGGSLMREAIRTAQQAGLWNLTLMVRTFNTPAIALYERCGFTRVGTLKAVARVGEDFADEYLYQLVLPLVTA